ncbi:MAG: Glutaredoxin [Candidatus Ozemobacter sibiricus]|jgi:glutaredoxin|uniref:Glutaredoxin n=1 Tax=Candidatus Ozemobacter sibiricus TaxID=2268124 RepID=A0A367ZSZ1_9BACT|nr:MAG: Glutaredoxin [Candidatus Ozemobacter sibiricus]
MKKFTRMSLFMVALFAVAITQTGCNAQRIGDFVQKVVGVVKGVVETIKNIKSGGGSSTSDTDSTPGTTATTPTDSSSAPPADTPSTNSGAASCQITVYGAAWCKACQAAKAYFEKKGSLFTYKDVEKDAGAKDEMKKKLEAAGQSGNAIPVIDICGTIVIGFDQAKIEKILKEKGASGASTPAAAQRLQQGDDDEELPE